MQPIWSNVDSYFSNLLIAPDAALENVLRESAAAHLPAINVSPNQGKFLHLLAKIHGAKKILEIGTLGGYSTIWLARALPAEGKIVTLEFDPKHAEVARKNFASAGLSNQIDLRLGRAIDILPKLAEENLGPFDFIFIDADKINTADYFAWALKLSRAGSVIIVDNVVRDGKVIDAETTDASVQGIRKFNELLAKESRVDATAIQTVGAKGYDGFVIAVVQ